MRSMHLRRQRGMTLLETLIVVGIAVAVIGGIVHMMQRFAERERSELAVKMQGQEMANLAKAVREYGNTVGADWDDGTHNEVLILDLIDAGLLPEGFGDRDGTGVVGKTPIGQRYKVFSVKDGGAYDDPLVEDGTVRSVVIDDGAPNAGRLERAGIPNITERITAHKEAIALYTTRETRVAMGVLVLGSEVVRGVGRAFTKDILAWIQNPLPRPAVVALVGFPDLDPPGSSTPTGGVEQYADCQVMGDHEGCGAFGCVPYDPPTCSSPWVELARPRLCGLGGTTVTSTPVGVVVGGLASSFTTTGMNNGAICNLSRNTVTAGIVTINGAEIYRVGCTTTQATSGWVYAPPDPIPTCATTTTGADEHPGVVGHPDAYGVLCCLPRD